MLLIRAQPSAHVRAGGGRGQGTPQAAMQLPVQHSQLGGKAPPLAAQPARASRRAKAAKLAPMATATVDRPASTASGASNSHSAYGAGTYANGNGTNGAAKADGPVILNGQVRLPHLLTVACCLSVLRKAAAPQPAALRSASRQLLDADPAQREQAEARAGGQHRRRAGQLDPAHPEGHGYHLAALGLPARPRLGHLCG